MPDDKKKIGKADRDRVSANEPYEVARIAKKFELPKPLVQNVTSRAHPDLERRVNDLEIDEKRVGEALCVEIAFALASRPLLRTLLAGGLIGTAGLATEWGWTWVWSAQPWQLSMLPHLWFDTATYGRRALDLVMSIYGFERLLFGSDLPVVDPGPGVDAFVPAVAKGTWKP